MNRQVLLILIALTQLAALPLSFEPVELDVGTPVTLSITVTDKQTEFVGFPDLGTFALLKRPERVGDTFTIHLLPLRPGKQTLPEFRFRTGRKLESTEPVTLTISDARGPEKPHPLKPFPDSAERQPSPLRNLLLIIVSGFAGIGLALSIFLRRRRTRIAPSTPDLDQQLTQLAIEARQWGESDNPEWQRFLLQLEKARFSPLPRHRGELQALTEKFKQLRGES